MPSAKYNPHTEEPELAARWEREGTYRHDPASAAPVYSIDTPPPTVSGLLHLGHVYSYSHADFVARFWRMRGRNVYYPMGFDDNGLPTERLVEKETGKTAEQIGRAAFIRLCLETGRRYEQEYEALWRRLGLSIDWRHTYRTIDDVPRKLAQQSFIDLYHKGLVYRLQAPTIWCPTCHTAIAQAEEKDLDRQSEFVDLAFYLQDVEPRRGGRPRPPSLVDAGESTPVPDWTGRAAAAEAPRGYLGGPPPLRHAGGGGGDEIGDDILPIATTRPELLPACVAIFVHPDDARYRDLVGRRARVPLFGQEVPILTDPAADPEKGTGAVMCCTFGDTIDVEWWRTYNLPLRETIDRHGRLAARAGDFAGMPVEEARRAIKAALAERGELLGRRPVEQSVRVHERCDTPVEYIVTWQWFTRVLEQRATWLRAGERLIWRPDHMKARYREWVEGLRWDWCISRQRYYGVTFPVWYCEACGEVVLAAEAQLPVDPTTARPEQPCACGNSSFRPEEDVMDTWATSCLSPQIAGQLLTDPALYAQVFPMSLRPQAHEIIRTWAFYTIVMSHHRFESLPWREVLISGWGLAPGGTEKISKSRGTALMGPMEMVERYSADACRYWAASTGLGKDAIISEEKIQAGGKLVTKLWNVAGFSTRFLEGYAPPDHPPAELSPADRWILSRIERVIRDATAAFESYEYAAAKTATEEFFWRDLCDNYLEMAKKRLYDGTPVQQAAARYALHRALSGVVLLFAPILPYICEAVHATLFARDGASVHRAAWPAAEESLIDPQADRAGEALMAIATAVRRHKSDRSLSLGAPLSRLQITADADLLALLRGAEEDLASVTRAVEVVIGGNADASMEVIWEGSGAMPIRVLVG